MGIIIILALAAWGVIAVRSIKKGNSGCSGCCSGCRHNCGK